MFERACLDLACSVRFQRSRAERALSRSRRGRRSHRSASRSGGRAEQGRFERAARRERRRLVSRQRSGPRARSRAGPTNSPSKPAEKTKRRGKIVYVALAIGILFVFGWASYRPSSTPVATKAAKRPPAIVGVLQVADLATGRKINPGEAYAFDLPTGKVRVAVVAGEVALTSKSGQYLRSFSNQSFVVRSAPDSGNSTHPLVSACGRQPSFLRAEIPQPPLPSPAPPVAISPSTLRAE